MGIDTDPGETIFGIEVCDWQQLWDAIFLENEEPLNKKAKIEEKPEEKEAVEKAKKIKQEKDNDDEGEDDDDDNYDNYDEDDYESDFDEDEMKEQFNELADEGMRQFWAGFAKLYSEKYEDLKYSGVTGFIGSKRGIEWNYVRNTDQSVVLGQEVVIERLKVVGGKSEMIYSLPNDFYKVAHDFLAFNMKFGNQFIKAFLKQETFTDYYIVPEAEAEELVKKSGIKIPENLDIHKFVSVL